MNLKTALFKNGITQEKLALVSGINQATLSRYARGLKAIPADHKSILEQILKCEIEVTLDNPEIRPDEVTKHYKNLEMALTRSPTRRQVDLNLLVIGLLEEMSQIKNFVLYGKKPDANESIRTEK